MINIDRKKEILSFHTHNKYGTPYWIDFFKSNHLDIDRVIEEPLSVPPMDIEALRKKPLEFFVPKSVLDSRQHLIMGETSGFTGKPVVTVYTEEEFYNAFVKPFLDAAQSRLFPIGGKWLWAGPTGPHIVGKAIRAILKNINGLDPFSVDFDPRWYKKLPETSLSRQRYMAHIYDQIMDIVNFQNIDVIFSTPPIIAMLGEKLDKHWRDSVKGIHYGGIGMSYEEYRGFHELFPNSAHISGYGNTLAGVFIEETFDHDGIEYKTLSDRVEISIVKNTEKGISLCGIGDRGQVMLSRYDQSFLILNMLERDWAVRTETGIKNPCLHDSAKLQKVLY